VTDATWHHFVNINLVGVVGAPDNTVKGRGFLASPEGRGHLEKIKSYYRNIAVWDLPRLGPRLLSAQSVVGLALPTSHHGGRDDDARPLAPRGECLTVVRDRRHARDVLGQVTSRCQTERLIIDLVLREIPELILEIDPWEPPPPDPDPEPRLPWLDPTPLLSIALGGALVALRDAFPTRAQASRTRSKNRPTISSDGGSA
jgi:hypothetical protein